MRKVLNRYLPYGGTFIDLGANEGYFSVLASHIVGPEGRVVAIEPQSRLQEVIRENLSVNHCSNVRLIRCVVAGETGRMRLSLAPSTNTGSSSLFRGTKYPIPTEEVESFNLADLLDKADLDSCDLMKVDIEGAEYDVFMAAKEVLEKGILRNIALEYHEGVLSSRGLSREELHDQMIESGYEINQDFGHCLYSFRR
ncbi:MAG: FkbM family methyltransferase [Acidobacteriia bacterium]|nr:FkbM family methyltransferase [Terriglobia bacterium]MBV8904118.1 FkbM family methyltransferase [Terriglobia bacterium]MBV9743843.1 FkbM family methyltransferase [Terriglobia bacterium]